MKKSLRDKGTKLLTKLIKHVDWQTVEKHETKGSEKRPSRTRIYIAGIPKDSLKTVYTKHNKALLNRFGVQMHCVSQTKTGETIQRKNRKIEVVKRQWEVRLWLNDNNAEVMAGLMSEKEAA